MSQPLLKRTTPLAPTNLAYTSYLLATAHAGPFHEAVAALLPCYWIYWEVGKELERAGAADKAEQQQATVDGHGDSLREFSVRCRVDGYG